MEKFEKHEVWHAAWTRLHRKMLALHERKRTVILRQKSRGEEPPDMSEAGAAMTPIASLNPTGGLVIDKDLKAKIRKLGMKQSNG